MKKITVILLFSCLFFCFTVEKSQAVFSNYSSANNNDTEYVCMPCGSDCDKEIHKKPGVCTHCNMELVDKSTVHFRSIEPKSLCSFIDDVGKDNVLLLDVRTKQEFDGKASDKFGRLAGAVNIPIQELPKRMNELKKYQDKEIIVYCSHSHRSPRASYLLMQNGFGKVTNMEYGMSEWKNKVKPDCSKILYVEQ